MNNLYRLKISDNKNKWPFTKIEGSKNMLMIKFGVEGDELEKLLKNNRTKRKR